VLLKPLYNNNRKES